MTRDRNATAKPPYDAEALERTALFYAGRYATTRAKLAAYLRRKLHENGGTDTTPPDVDGLVQRMAGLGYVDDRAFASAKAAALGRRGLGPRRVDLALRAAGIDEEDGSEARALASADAWSAALRHAERRKIRPLRERRGRFRAAAKGARRDAARRPRDRHRTPHRRRGARKSRRSSC